MKTSKIPFSKVVPFALTLLIAGSAAPLGGCASPERDPAEHHDNDVTTRDPEAVRQPESGAPLTEEEKAFEPFFHVDKSAGGWPAHDFAGASVDSTSGADRVGARASLYLETDRTFTLYYDESVFMDAFSSRTRTRRKLTGAWTVIDGSLSLGPEANATIGPAADHFGHPTPGLSLSLPSGWAGDGFVHSITLIRTQSNVGPDAGFWSEYQRGG